MTTMKSLEDYLSLKYRVDLLPEEDGGYFARHPELRGCHSVGDTDQEALANLSEARVAWIAANFDAKLPIPEPAPVEEASGRVLVRMPPWLHAALTDRAQDQGISLNQTIVSLLAHACGRAEGVNEVTSVIDRIRESVQDFQDALSALQSVPPMQNARAAIVAFNEASASRLVTNFQGIADACRVTHLALARSAVAYTSDRVALARPAVPPSNDNVELPA